MSSENKGILIASDTIINQIKSSDKKIYSIVLTGGPSAGKSTIIQFVKKYFDKYNSNKKPDSEKIYVLTLNEIATHLSNQGITFTGYNEGIFQKLIMSNQISMEKTIYMYAEAIAKHYDKVVILMDRGLVDGKAYIIPSKIEYDDQGIITNEQNIINEINTKVEEEWNKMLTELNLTNEYKEHLLKYDTIIHIITGAQGSGFFYTTENNSARTETPIQALERDKKTLMVWEQTVKTPIYVLDNREGIICRQGKGVQIIKMISKLIGREYTNIFIDVSTTKESLVGGYLKYKSKYIKLKKEIKK